MGDNYVSGQQCYLKTTDGSIVKTYQKNGNIKGVKPADGGNYQVSQCVHTTLSQSEIADIKSAMQSFVAKISEDSGDSIVLNPTYHEVGGDMELTGWDCGRYLAPWNLHTMVDGVITRDTDFIFVFYGITDSGTGTVIDFPANGATYGALMGINGAGYSVMALRPGMDLVQVTYHEWLHQLYTAYKDLMGVSDIYNDNFPKSLCGNSAANTYSWMPHADLAQRDPDFLACVSYYDNWPGYCSYVYPANCDYEWQKHILAAHYNKTVSLIGNHCRTGRQDAGESGIDIGGYGVASCH